MKKICLQKRLMIILYEIILYFLILLSFSLRWCTAHFGNISMSEIIFTLNMPLKGTPNEYFYAYFTEAFLASVAGYMGLWLIVVGVVKKAIIADYISQYNDLAIKTV